MKKLMIIVATLAMVLSLMPKAEAGETAELGLSVTFDQPLKIWSEPEGPFTVTEGDEITFNVIAEDLDADVVEIYDYIIPEGASLIMPTDSPQSKQRPVGIFLWKPEVGQAQDGPYVAVFYARSYVLRPLDQGGQQVVGEEKFAVEITVKPLPVIAIELEPTTWVLEGVKLGEKRDNIAYFGADVPIHHVKNTGNVDVGVDIGYGYLIAEGIQPGRDQGLDTFITGLGRVDNHVLLEPNGKLMVGGAKPGDVIPLWLTYGAPTALSNKDEGHRATYELRAYPVTE